MKTKSKGEKGVDKGLDEVHNYSTKVRGHLKKYSRRKNYRNGKSRENISTRRK